MVFLDEPLNVRISRMVKLEDDHLLPTVVMLLRYCLQVYEQEYHPAIEDGVVAWNSTVSKLTYLTEHRVNNAIIRCLYFMVTHVHDKAYRPEKATRFYMRQLSYLGNMLLTWRICNEPD